uniref:Sieve element occlusion N-terminal domain-containing protein n=1 Tax=Cajanus cajan TaxID=3821 RepID=A0A151TKQ7_CAJCA|nr:hypothetical protein KK1_023961 [Cajanus cajan]
MCHNHGNTSMLSRCSWVAKVVITFVAFEPTFGEFWLVTRLYATNRLVKFVAMLKHIHQTLKQREDLGPKFEITNNLLIVQFHELPSQYIDFKAPTILTTSTLILDAIYCIVTRVYMTSTTETWELSNLAHRLDNINNHLAYPFPSSKEEAQWNEETWDLALLADTI